MLQNQSTPIALTPLVVHLSQQSDVDASNPAAAASSLVALVTKFIERNANLVEQQEELDNSWHDESPLRSLTRQELAERYHNLAVNLGDWVQEAQTVLKKLTPVLQSAEAQLADLCWNIDAEQSSDES